MGIIFFGGIMNRPYSIKLKTGYFSVLLLLLAALIVPTTQTEAATHVISSLPYNVSQSSHSSDTWDTLVFAQSRLESQTDGIIFGTSTHHWVVLLQEDTLVFGIDSTYRPAVYTGARGIGFNYYSSDIIVKGGYYLHSPSNITGDETSFDIQDTLNSYNNCFSISGAHDILIDSVRYAIVKGYNSHVSDGGSYNVTISNSHFVNRCHVFDSRCLFRVACYKREFSYTPTGDEYSVRLIGNNFESYSHTAVYIYGKNGALPRAEIEACTLKIDMRNYVYDDYDGTCHSTTNGYCVQFSMAGPGSYVKDCYMYAGDEFGGGRGIFLNYVQGSAAEPIEISGNYMRMHEGYNVEFSPTIYAPCGIKIRQESEHVWVHDNVLVQISDLGWGLGEAYHYNGEPIVYQIWDENPTGPYNITIENNVCSSLVVTPNNGDDYMVSGAKFDFITVEDTSFHWRNNYVYSEGNHGYDYGQYDGPSSYIKIYDDVVDMNNSKVSEQHTFNVGDYRGCYENEAIDVTYLNNASPYSVSHMFQGGPTGGSADQEITIKRTVDIRVTDTTGYNIENAVIRLINGYGQTVLQDTTTKAGKISGEVTYYYAARVAADSVNFNNFTIIIEKGSDSYTKDIEINDTTLIPTCTLYNTSGVFDNTPPDPVLDLGAIGGPYNGSVIIEWTATGDDGSVGTASHYVIKYSTSPIDASNFETVSGVVPSPPDPVSPGSLQSDTVRNLTPGEVYYFAMKVYDYVDQSSTISNIVTAEATLSISSGGEEDYTINSTRPTNGVVLTTLRPTLSAQNVAAIGSNNYYFEIADNQTFSPVLYSSGPVAQQSGDGFTDWQVPASLEADMTYYWHVAVNDYPFNSTSNFSTSANAVTADGFELNPYPNPVRFRQGERVIFNLPDQEGDLLIQTLTGETVLLKKGISGYWEWDGHNEASNSVAIGGKYLWYYKSDQYNFEGIIVTVP